MKRKIGRWLLGRAARLRFAAYTLSSGSKNQSRIEEAHFPTGNTADTYELTSPDGRLRVSVPKSGQLRYWIQSDNTAVIEESCIGMKIQSNIKLGSDVSVGMPSVTNYDEKYYDYDSDTYINDCHNSFIMPVLELSSGLEYRLEFRIWNDGAGFRLLFQKDTGLLISDELTEFNVPINTLCRYQKDFKKLQGKTLEQQTRYLPRGESFPCLTSFELPESKGYIMLTEANIQNYPGAALFSKGKGRFKIDLWDSDKFFIKGGGTPWRLIIFCKNLEELVNCKVISHAASPMDPIYDNNTDWIVPGKSAWSYFVGDDSQDFEKIKEHNAFAQQAGYQYNLIDSGWRRWAKTERKRFEMVKEIVKDAESRGVGIWLWRSVMDHVWFAPYRRFFLRRCKKAGIKGIKLDHIESETQFMTNLYRRFAKEAAELQMMVIYHNPQKPTGLRRSFPNVMSMEAIRGLQCDCDADDDTILPFTRMVAGNADYTPMCFSDPENRGDASLSHLLAATIIYQSAFLTISESPQVLKQTAMGPFISALPVIWNETHVLEDTEIGKSVVLARRNGDSWYIAAFNSAQGERDANISFSFLPENAAYELELFFDELSDPLSINYRTAKVTRDDKIDVIMRSSGGFAGRLKPIA